MKGCPSCSQLYAGDQIRFCRWDGATLQLVVVKLDDETTRDLLRKIKQKTSAHSSGRLAIKIEGRS
ncbi:MAG TPA: hypothetical protein VIX17_00610 [Pyrinomonadaceae bacterium]